MGKIAIKLNEGDELISVQLTNGRDEILVASSSGKCIRFAEDDVRMMGRDTQGVRAMKIGDDEEIVDMTVVKDGHEIITVSEFGYGKRTDLNDYRLQSRAGKGIKAGTFTAKTGKLVNMKQINPDDDVMLIADNGIIIRMRAKEISKIGRDTQGVRIMKLKNQGTVVGVAVASPEIEIEEEGSES